MSILQGVGKWAAAGAILLALGGVASGQLSGSGSSSGTSLGGARGSGSQAGQSNSPSQVLPPIGPDTPLSPQTEEQQAKMRNVERQKELVADTQKLLSLANELKADVDKSTKDTLSLDVVRKADEIEKLAHNVKEKMKCSGCGPYPTLTP